MTENTERVAELAKRATLPRASRRRTAVQERLSKTSVRRRGVSL